MGPVRSASDGSNGTVADTADIVFEIAAVRGVDAADLSTRLHDVIDTDALERFLRSADRETRVTFTYEDLRIDLTGDGELSIDEVSDEE